MTIAEIVAKLTPTMNIRHYANTADEIVTCISGSEVVESSSTNRWARIRFPDGSTGVLTDYEMSTD